MVDETRVLRLLRAVTDRVALLGVRGVLDPALAGSVRRAVGFRNVLVHDYAEVDDRIVQGRLADLGDLRDFVASVLRWLERA